MEVNFNMDPHDILRLSMTIFYEKNLNQLNVVDASINIKDKIVSFITNEELLSNELIDKIATETSNDQETFEIKGDYEERKNLWLALINQEEFKNYMAGPLLESSVYDKKTKKEYPCNFGEHFIGILSALKDANIDTENNKVCDKYIESFIEIRGKNGLFINVSEFYPEINEMTNLIGPFDIVKFLECAILNTK